MYMDYDVMESVRPGVNTSTKKTWTEIAKKTCITDN